MFLDARDGLRPPTESDVDKHTDNLFISSNAVKLENSVSEKSVFGLPLQGSQNRFSCG